MRRRTFMLASAAAVLGRAAYGQSGGEMANSAACRAGLVWQPMVPASPDIPALNGHTDTMLDIVGRLGSKIDLAIFTEGNHFPALLGGPILDAFRTRTRSGNSAVDNTSSSSPCRNG
jgi:hypothetical protein